jgi:hypothetical protein
VRKEVWELLGFLALVWFGSISDVVEGAFVRDCRGLGLYTIGQSADCECVEGMVTGWEGIREEEEDRRRNWMRRGRKSSWEREQWIVLQEKEGK